MLIFPFLCYEVLHGPSPSPTTLDNGTIIYHFSYTGDYYHIQIRSGSYKFICHGAQGGYGQFDGSIYYGCTGAILSGEINFSQTQDIYIYVGGKGADGENPQVVNHGGFNGGGDSSPGMVGTYFLAGGGGGASDIRLSPFVTDRILVASGASGSAGNAFGAPGGYTHGWHPTRGKSHGYTESVYTTQSSGCSTCPLGTGESGADDLRYPESGGGGGYYGGVACHHFDAGWSVSDSGTSYASDLFSNVVFDSYSDGSHLTEDGHGYVELIIFYECNEICSTCY